MQGKGGEGVRKGRGGGGGERREGRGKGGKRREGRGEGGKRRGGTYCSFADAICNIKEIS